MNKSTKSQAQMFKEQRTIDNYQGLRRTNEVTKEAAVAIESGYSYQTYVSKFVFDQARLTPREYRVMAEMFKEVLEIARERNAAMAIDVADLDPELVKESNRLYGQARCSTSRPHFQDPVAYPKQCALIPTVPNPGARV